MSSARELFQPRSKRQDQTNAPTTQSNFDRGLIKNAPHDDLPPGSLAGLINAHAFPTEVQPRLGTRILNFTPPAIKNRTNYTASKSGRIITSLSGSIFTKADVSNYWVWPDEKIHDEITGYISATQMRARDSGEKDSTSGCWMHGRLNLWEYHYSKEKIVMQWGQEVYISSPKVVNGKTEITSLVHAICVSYNQPANVVSDWAEMDEYGVIFNSNGTYLVDFKTSPPTIFKKNTPEPTVLIDDSPQTDYTKYRYDVVYSMSRLSGNGLRNRSTEGTEIMQESATTRIDEEQETPRDNAVIFTEKRIDSGLRTNGALYGGGLDRTGSWTNFWVGINDGTFELTINGITELFIVDFSIATGVAITSMEEVAAEIQHVIRLIFYFATCEYDKQNMRFIFTSGEEPDSIIDFGGNGTGGTNIAGNLAIREGDGDGDLAYLDNANIFAEPQSDGIYTVPIVTSGVPAWHWTHFVKYRTPDIGPDGVWPRMGLKNEILPPLKFHYTIEVRVAGAFYASRDRNGLVTARRGQFEIYDVGTPLEWEDGEIETINQYISETQVRVSMEYYYGEAKVLQACAIGGGRVIRASQTGYIVTVYGGDVFTIDDERKIITWSTGYYSIIRDYISPTSVRVYDNIDKEMQGLTLDPVNRVINDNVNDQTLRNRQGNLHVGLLNHRFWTEMPNVNIGEISPGFMVTAIKNFTKIYYCQLGVSVKYLSGYFLENRQTNDKVENSIQTLKVIMNKMIVFCKGSTWGAPTNEPRIYKLPEFGEHYAVLFFDIIDENIGVTDINSIEKIDSGLLELRCSDSAVRQFNGFQYTQDFTVDLDTGQDRIKKDFKDCWAIGTSIYTDKTGHIFWEKMK